MGGRWWCRTAKTGFLGLGICLVLVAASQLHSPYLARVRTPALVFLPLTGLCWIWRLGNGRKNKRAFWGNLLPLTACALMVALPMIMERHHELVRHQVMSTSRAELSRYSRHFVLGYRNPSQIKALLERMELGGIYISTRNVRGRTVAQVRREIAEIQAIQLAHGGPALLVMADQEGGLVSRLSPLLPQRPNLGQVLAQATDSNWRLAVLTHARDQAADLASIGVNCNLAPVVDLLVESPRGLDLHTKLSERATSPDPHKTAAAAQLYGLALRQHGILAVAKHFPGLGHVAQDTHHFEGHLLRPLSILEREDWLPFAALAQSDSSATMVGHVKVDQIDQHNLASASGPVIRGILRGQLGHRGLVLTDDLCMAPACYAPGGIGATALRALRASADLLLVTFDPDMFFPAMAHLLKQASDTEEDKALVMSSKRLAAVKQRIVASSGSKGQVAELKH